jgi:hypothetical protein
MANQRDGRQGVWARVQGENAKARSCLSVCLSVCSGLRPCFDDGFVCGEPHACAVGAWHPNSESGPRVAPGGAGRGGLRDLLRLGIGRGVAGCVHAGHEHRLEPLLRQQGFSRPSRPSQPRETSSLSIPGSTFFFSQDE